MTNRETILQKHTGLFWKVARAFARDAADQQDLVQEIVISVWSAASVFEGQSEETTFVYRVALNRALTWQRKRSTYRRHLRNFAMERGSPPAIDGDAATQDRLDALYAAIRKLPKIDRSIVLMHLDHFSYREIGEAVGLTESNIGARLSRARAKLAATIQSEEQHDAT